MREMNIHIYNEFVVHVIKLQCCTPNTFKRVTTASGAKSSQLSSTQPNRGAGEIIIKGHAPVTAVIQYVLANNVCYNGRTICMANCNFRFLVEYHCFIT